MIQWEYIRAFSITVDKMNELGKEGWELVNAVLIMPSAYEFFFKRKISRETISS